MNQNVTSSGNKTVVTIVIVVLLVLGFGYFLFRISPQEQQQQQNIQNTFDLSGVKKTTEPRPVSMDDHVKGNPGAKNTFIAYEDYQCPSCAVVDEMLNAVPNEFTDTKFIYRNFPLIQIHKNAVISAYAAEAAGEQGKFWEMHDLIFKNQSSWSELSSPLEFFAQLAQQAGVGDINKFKTDVSSGKYKERIQKDLVDALSLNLPGTPSMYFNGHLLKNGSLEDLKKQAEQYYIK